MSINYKLYNECVDKQIITDLLKKTDLNNDYFTILQNYKKINRANKTSVMYSQKYNGIGRLYANNNGCKTLQQMPRILRNTLARNKYIDLDMVCALPVIAYQECKKHNINCKYLKKYIKYRDNYLQQLQDEYETDRDTAKQLANRLMNGGGIGAWINDNNLNLEEDCDIPEFWVQFKNEMDAIYNGLYKVYYDYYKVVLDDNDKKWNEKARLCSIALQDKENDILQEAISFLTDLGFKVDVPIYDGMLIQAKDGIDDNLIDSLKDYIKQQLDYVVDWKVKPMDEGINLDDVNLDDDDWEFLPCKSQTYDASYCMMIEGDSQSKIYQRRKKYVEHFVVQTFHPENIFHFTNYKKKTISIFKRQGIIERLEDTLSGLVNDAGRPLSFTEVWLKDHNKNSEHSYYWVPFHPTNSNHLNNIEPDLFNTFSGYGDKINTDYNQDATRILDLWKDVVFNLCGGDDFCFHYYLCYLAQIVQDPSNKKGIAIGFKSRQGEGKGTHLSAFSKVIGEDHYFSSENMEDFFGKHAEAFPKRLLVNIDEVNGTHNYLNNIKAKITEDYCILNAKNHRPIKVRNFARVIFTMNNVNMTFDMGSEERRFVFFESNGENLKYKNKVGGWEKIVKHWKKPEHVSALYDFLNNYNIDIDLINDRPLTELYKTLLFKNKPYVCSFTEQFLTTCKWREFEPYLLGYEEQTEPNMFNDPLYDENIQIKASQFRKYLNNWLKESGYDFSLTPSKILPEFKNLNFPISYENKGGNNYYSFCPKVMYEYMVERKWIEEILLDQKTTDKQLEEYDDNLFLV
jgi:hypothetical protein